MDNSNELLDWIIQTMQCKADQVKVLLERVLQPVGLLSTEEFMKLQTDVVDELGHLFHNSL
jgi:hypothetical protein